MNCTIYNISHPVTKDIFRVGRTTSFEERKRSHFNGSGGRIASHLLTLKRNGIIPVFTELELCDNAISPDREQHWIDTYINLGYDLLNTYKASQQILTTRKQTYPFKTMAINDTFKIIKKKYNTMATSYRQHNKKHSPIVIQCSDMGTGYIQVKRTA